MPCHTRMKRIAQGLLWLFLLEFGFTVMSLEPGFLDFDNLPDTNFSCVGKVIGGYYADLETNCQMFHVCTIGQLDEPMDIRFLCLNGTVFDQETRVCERIDEVDCSKSEQFYSLNLELYGNTQPPILEESPEVDLPAEIKRSSTTTTTTTTTTRRPVHPKSTTPPYFTTSTAPTTTRPVTKVITSHHFPVVNAPDIRFNPEEINISLHPGAPPDITRSQAPVSFQQQSFSEKNTRVTVTTHTTSYKNDNKPHRVPLLPTPNPPSEILIEQDEEENQKIVESTQKPKSVVSYGLTHNHGSQVATPTEINYGFTYQQTEESVEYRTEVPHRSNFHYQSSIADLRPPTQLHPYVYQSHTTSKRPSKVNFPAPTTFRTHSIFSSSVKSSSSNYHPQRTEKPPRLQLPLPLLPTLPPLTFSSPAPFTLGRHIEAKRYTNEHQSPPRIIISASASVSDNSGRRLNYSLGTIGATELIGPSSSSYDDYKDEDVGLDPFYQDVPKIKSLRHKRSTSQEDVIKNEKEAEDLLRFLFNWYSERQREKKKAISIPVDSDDITEINDQLAPLMNVESSTSVEEDYAGFLDKIFRENVTEPSVVQNKPIDELPKSDSNLNDLNNVYEGAKDQNITNSVQNDYESVKEETAGVNSSEIKQESFVGNQANVYSFFENQNNGTNVQQEQQQTEDPTHNRSSRRRTGNSKSRTSTSRKTRKPKTNSTNSTTKSSHRRGHHRRRPSTETPQNITEVPEIHKTEGVLIIENSAEISRDTPKIKTEQKVLAKVTPEESLKNEEIVEIHESNRSDHILTAPGENYIQETKEEYLPEKPATDSFPEIPDKVDYNNPETQTQYLPKITQEAESIINSETPLEQEGNTEHQEKFTTVHPDLLNPEVSTTEMLTENLSQEANTFNEDSSATHSTLKGMESTLASTVNYPKMEESTSLQNQEDPDVENYYESYLKESREKEIQSKTASRRIYDDEQEKNNPKAVDYHSKYPPEESKYLANSDVHEKKFTTSSERPETNLPTNTKILKETIEITDHTKNTGSQQIPDYVDDNYEPLTYHKIQEKEFERIPETTTPPSTATTEELQKQTLTTDPTQPITLEGSEITTETYQELLIKLSELTATLPTTVTNAEHLTTEVYQDLTSTLLTTPETTTPSTFPTSEKLQEESITTKTTENSEEYQQTTSANTETTLDVAEVSVLTTTPMSILQDTTAAMETTQFLSSTIESSDSLTSLTEPQMKEESTTAMNELGSTTNRYQHVRTRPAWHRRQDNVKTKDNNSHRFSSLNRRKGARERAKPEVLNSNSPSNTEQPLGYRDNNHISSNIAKLSDSYDSSSSNDKTLELEQKQIAHLTTPLIVQELTTVIPEYNDEMDSLGDNKAEVTDAPLLKSANPTKAKYTKIVFTTTPLSKLVRVELRKDTHGRRYTFNCFDKEIHRFYSDPRDCRLFHYCTSGYTKNQLVDMKFVCDLGTYFDEENMICTKTKPGRCF